jgi:hypothetical protein
MASNALKKHEVFVNKAHADAVKMQNKADDILRDIQESQEKLRQKQELLSKIQREMDI